MLDIIKNRGQRYKKDFIYASAGGKVAYFRQLFYISEWFRSLVSTKKVQKPKYTRKLHTIKQT